MGTCCQIIYGKNKGIHCSLVPQLTSIRDECPLIPSQIKPSQTQSRTPKQRSNSLSFSHRAELWTDRLGCLSFSEGAKINSKLVYAVPKINLIQKGNREQSHHLPCPLRQIIARIVSTQCTQEVKLDMLTIQYSKRFCSFALRIVLPCQHIS